MCEHAHEGLDSETRVKMWKQQVGERRRLDFSFPGLLIHFACVSDTDLDLPNGNQKLFVLPCIFIMEKRLEC